MEHNNHKLSAVQQEVQRLLGIDAQSNLGKAMLPLMTEQPYLTERDRTSSLGINIFIDGDTTFLQEFGAYTSGVHENKELISSFWLGKRPHVTCSSNQR